MCGSCRLIGLGNVYTTLVSPVHTPKLSIGMPVHNGERFLRETMGSLLSQTFRDYELVISDNGSSDETEAICRSFAAQDGRVRYIRHHVNRGAAWNYNCVVREAKGQYFKWAAADDLCAAEYLERCVYILDNCPDVILSYPKTVIIDEEGNPKRPYDDQLHLLSPHAAERFRSLMTLIGECNAVFGVMRLQVLRRTALIANYIASDVALLAELSLHGKFFQVPDELFFRRDHVRASSSDKSIDSQMMFFDPAQRAKIVLPLTRRSRENLRAVWRAPVRLSEKLQLSTDVLWRAVRARDKYWREWCRAGGQLLRRFGTAVPRTKGGR